MDKIKVPEIPVGDLSSFIETSFNQLKADAEVNNEIKKLNVSDTVIKDNIAVFLEFQEDAHYCAKCPGVAKCAKERPHFQLRLSYDGKFLERAYAPCEKILKKWEQDIQYPLSDFPADWRDSSFSTINVTAERSKLILAADQLIQGTTKRWIFLTGNPKTGKSFLAATIVNELIKSKKGPAAFLNTPVRFKELSDMQFEQKEAFRKTLDFYAQVPILVLDDFGNEYKSDFIRDTILFPILSERSKNEKITLFTSDFSLDEIAVMYGGNANAQIRANQIKRLLLAMCKSPIELKGLSVY